ncbi:galactosylceramide sulfotransferase [Exaiptasia diaphana]|uniref:Uncharacterized protein n=1 Tax=Exaiptasia diaphana TaxID=2652724 RepID=A0A913Y5K2_EXADI|nr:galactosylceramide sulfotransferase [Exaiptasia diaphana]KXJ22384.1 Galactose-3-O-sulfotransferase 3 [Exaiptasia diaphana]
MKTYRNAWNSSIISAIFLGIVIVLVVFNSINSSLYSEQVENTIESWKMSRHLYATKLPSLKRLYYLDKHGYRIALQSEATEHKTLSLPISRLQPTVAETDLNGYDVMHGENEAERDETIDYNFNLHDLNSQEDASPRKRPKCDGKNAIQKVVLLKTHRTGSSTLANILYRYGDLNDLEFALPKESSYEYYWPVPFNPSFTDKRYLNSSRPPHMLVNARLHLNSMAMWKREGAFLIAVVRDPVSHFESSFYRKQLDFLFRLENTSNPFAEFLKSPEQSFKTYLKNERKIDTKLNLAVNGQMFDLGLMRTHFTNENEISRTIEALHEIIDLVLISEYMDESLVLLKRALCWDIDDVLYFTHKQRHKDYKDLEITSEMMRQIHQWNQADSLLYKYFNHTLWKRISEQDNSFYNELKELKMKKMTLEKQCITSTSIEPDTGEIMFKIEEDVPSYNKYLCDKMNTNEKDYIAYLKTKARVKFQKEDLYIKRQFQGLEERIQNSTGS